MWGEAGSPLVVREALGRERSGQGRVPHGWGRGRGACEGRGAGCPRPGCSHGGVGCVDESAHDRHTSARLTMDGFLENLCSPLFPCHSPSHGRLAGGVPTCTVSGRNCARAQAPVIVPHNRALCKKKKKMSNFPNQAIEWKSLTE